jgi:transposase
LLFATPGRDKATLGKFASDLTEHGGQPTAITHVSMDMSGSFQAGAAEHFPAAEVCFDRFHVVALSSTALDEVRRAEVKSEPELKGTRWGLHKKPADWTVKQTDTMHWLQRSNLKTARAWRIKQALRSIYATATTPDEASPCSSAGSAGPAAADSNPSSASAGRSPSIFLAYSTVLTPANTTAGSKR